MSHPFNNRRLYNNGFTPTPISRKIGVSSQGERGFTLVELMVTIGIMVAILTVILFNQRSYTEAIALNNLADNISITLSQAQAYGIAVREVTTGSADFNTAYGVAFSADPNFRNSFIFFADRDGNGAYSSGWDCPIGGNSECLEKVTFSHGNYIEDVCRVRNNPSNPYQCPMNRVDVSFLRPNAEPRIMVFNPGGNLMDYDPDFIGVRISLRSVAGFTRSILIYYTGQISVVQ
jgi:prepilin-type N-terminal cleavage/methylation domain-containing protein